MKKNLLIIAVVGAAIGSLSAQTSQDQSSASDTPVDQQQTQSTTGEINQPAGSLNQNDPASSGSRIDEPAGADRPNGRAFSTTNPPPGRPFEGGAVPPGRPFEERSGAQQPAATPDDRQDNQSSDPQSEQPQPGQQPDIQAQPDGSSANPNDQAGAIQNEAAGAARTQSKELASAFEGKQKTQIERAIKANITTSGKVPDEFVTRLSSDVSAVLTSVQLEPDARVRLADAISIILNTQPSNQAEVQRAFTTVQTILVPSGRAATPMAQAAVCDLHLIATQLAPDIQLDLPTTRVRVE